MDFQKNGTVQQCESAEGLLTALAAEVDRHWCWTSGASPWMGPDSRTNARNPASKLRRTQCLSRRPR